MALAKDKHYWSQLWSALTAGHWSSPTPARTPRGDPLSWSELFRKFNKHVKGFTDVTHIASQTQALALLLGANSREGGLTGNQPSGPLALGDECVLLEERISEVSEGLEVLKKLESSKLNSLHFTLSYYAYALGRPQECLSYLSKVPNLPDIQSHIPTSAVATRPNAESTLRLAERPRTSSFVSATSSASVADLNDGKAWAITETIRSICLQGMSHEKLSPSHPEKALKAYATALPILTIVESEIPRTLPATGAGKFDFSSFTRFRELWLWIERLLWRAIVLASWTCPLNHIHGQTIEDSKLLWTLFSHYRTCSIYWPTKFSTEHRSTVAVLHLRALLMQARILNSRTPERSSLDADRPPPAWLTDAKSVIQEYRAILNVSTRFPKAGDRNTKVEDFVDLCVAVWEAGGAVGDHTGWVIDILWWATRLTFNSYKIYRHMTRVFYISGDPQLARRTLRLYVQVVGKAWEAGGAGVGGDADTNRHWVETLIQGARMLCRLPGCDGVEDAREAGVLVDKAKTRLDKDDKELVGSVCLAEGIWSSVMALVEHDTRTRPERLAHALAQFAMSIETFPTPSAYYHLAIALAKPGPQQDLDQAIASAGSAVEGASGDIRFWHLLGLLLTANGSWAKARAVLEIGAGIGEKGEEESEDDDLTEEGGDAGTNRTNVKARDFGTTESKNGEVNGHGHVGLTGSGGHSTQPVFLLDKDCRTVPPAATLLQPIPDYPTPSRQDMFEYAMQLRMTQLALAEYVEGAEGAGLKWVEVFGWVADRKGVVAEQQRSSTDTARVSEEIRQFSDYIHTSAQALEGGNPAAALSSEKQDSNEHHKLNGVHEEIIEPPPITVTPATPDHNTHFPTIEKRSTSIDQDSSKGKKVQQMLKNRVHKSHARISTISKKIGHGMARNGGPSNTFLRRATSAPDFHTLLQHSPYQASSIHSRRRLSFIRHHEPSPSPSPPPPPPVLSPGRQEAKWNRRTAKENRLLSNLWLMSAATFRRHGKIEQAKGAIQEGEVKDEDNPAVWVQLGLYNAALGHDRHAIDAFHKALFISPDDVAATVHLCRVYLSPSRTSNSNQPDAAKDIDPDNVDLAAGMLSHAVDGAAWDVPEAWYFLAKAYGLQDRKDKEREALTLALSLSERRSVRDIGLAVGWCL